MEKPQHKDSFDSLDKFALTVKRNITTIIKAVPAIVGFTIFLMYFCEHHFFPSFDLFSLGSLLIAASVLGILIFLLITLGISLPGLIWTDMFLKDKIVRDELSYYLSKTEDKEKKEKLSIIRIYFFYPAVLATLTSLLAILVKIEEPLYLTAFLALYFLLAGTLKYKYHLSWSSLLKYTLASTFAFVIASIVSIFFAFTTIKLKYANEPEHYQLFVVVAISILMTMAFTLCAISFHSSKYSHTIFFSMLFAVFISVISNMWITLPGGITKILGIGNYLASEVHVNGAPCKIESIPWKKTTEKNCVLENVRIIWGLGDTHRIQIQNKDETKDISVPTKNITSIIKSNQTAKPQ